MKAKRIIPCLDIKDGRVVKGVNFLNLVDAGDPVENARFYDSEGADELCFLNIAASSDKKDSILDMIKKVSETIHIPFTVGGGIGTVEDVRLILESGADKVSISTAAFLNPELITQAAKESGSQRIIAAIDAKKNNKGGWTVFINGGKTATEMDVVDWAVKTEKLGAGEILLTSMDKDGTKDGYDIELTRQVAEAVNIPVIASGGAGTVEHLYEGLTKGKADAVLAASIFHFREISIKEVKEKLIQKGVPIRSA
ncbi:MAG: imidazole glycerol phosphate synthase subunit HisF [Spirochaetota bacterium]